MVIKIVMSKVQWGKMIHTGLNTSIRFEILLDNESRPRSEMTKLLDNTMTLAKAVTFPTTSFADAIEVCSISLLGAPGKYRLSSYHCVVQKLRRFRTLRWFNIWQELITVVLLMIIIITYACETAPLSLLCIFGAMVL